MRRLFPALLLPAMLLACSLRAEDTIIEIEVQAGKFNREQTPVILRLPGEVADDRQLVMQRVEDRKRIGLQRIAGDHPSVAWMIEKPLAAGVSRKYSLIAVTARSTESPSRSLSRRMNDGWLSVCSATRCWPTTMPSLNHPPGSTRCIAEVAISIRFTTLAANL